MNVYFSSSLPQLYIDTPYPLIKERDEILFKKDTSKNREVVFLNKCPAYNDSFKNIFVLTFPYDYTIEFNDTNIYSKNYDQEFYDICISPRDAKLKFLSINLPSAIFFAEDDLEMEIIHPYLHNHELAAKGKLLPGKYNIGKHLRALEFPYVFSENKITIKRGDPIAYIKFYTDEKIYLKRFYYTEELRHLSNSVISVRNRTTFVPRGLNFFYDLFKNSIGRKYILKKIKENLI